MGAVYLADQTLMDEARAIKFLARQWSRDEAFTARFRREVRTLRQVRHKNVIDSGDLEQAEDESLFFAMEFVDGPDLRSFLDRAPRPFDVRMALELTRSIAEGLGAAHAKGMVHRDIKPENVLMAREGDTLVPKIADFGIVATKESSGTRTRTGASLLTYPYAAPEQWRGMKSAELDGRTDIYALGGLLFEMLTGETVFDAESYEGWAEQHKNATPRTPSSVRRDLAQWKGLDALVLRMLAKDREDRPLDTAELAALLNGIHRVEITGREIRRQTVVESGNRAVTVVEKQQNSTPVGQEVPVEMPEVPQPGGSFLEGTLTEWTKMVGERVQEDERLFVISNPELYNGQLDCEFGSPNTGVLSEIRVPAGGVVRAHTVLGTIRLDAAEGTGAGSGKTPEPEPEPAAEAKQNSLFQNLETLADGREPFDPQKHIRISKDFWLVRWPLWKVVAAILVTIAVIAGLVYINRPPSSSSTAPAAPAFNAASPVGTMAPDFTIYGEAKIGYLYHLRGRVVVLNFWSSLLENCGEEMPVLQKLQTEQPDLAVLGMSNDEYEAQYDSFLRRHHVSYATIRDPNEIAAKLYHSEKWPETYVIDRQGVIRKKYVGPQDWSSPEIREFLKSL